MGTFISVKTAQELDSDRIFLLFSELDQTLSTYKPDSEISRLNRGERFEVSLKTRDILNRSIEIHQMTDGAFDITVGAWTHKGYRFGYKKENVLDDQKRESLGLLTGMNRMHMDDTTVWVQEGTTLDLGGIAKGYAVDLSLELLEHKGVSESVVSASGDIGCLGECTVWIQNPFVPNGYIGKIHSNLPRLAVSTSGNYERYIKSKENNHLLNPKTGKPQQIYASVTLISDKDNTKLDALATAVTVMDEQKALYLLQKEQIAFVLIHNDGTCIQSPLMKGISLEEKNIECQIKK